MLHRPPHQSNVALRPLVLTCFGRGGSNIVFGALGSAPFTRTMRHEWHQAVFANANWMRRGLRYLSRRGFGLHIGTGDGPVGRVLRNIQSHRVLADLRSTPPWTDAAPEWMVIKLMDHNIVRLPLIEQSFGPGQVVCLTRAPLPQCESLMRSGLTVAEAIQWYNDVARDLVRIRPRAITITFENLVENPLDTLDSLSLSLGLPPTDIFYLKDKSFGAHRVTDTDVTHAAICAVRRSDLRTFVRPDVNQRAVERLSSWERKKISVGTRDAAAQLGYSDA